jgi:hypothetical protein
LVDVVVCVENEEKERVREVGFEVGIKAESKSKSVQGGVCKVLVFGFGTPHWP